MKIIRFSALLALSLTAVPALAQPISVELDLFEIQQGQGDDPFVFDGEIAVGEGRVAGVFKIEGGHEAAHLDVDEVTGQALLAFSPKDGTTLLAGVRHDFRPGRDLTYATLAIEQALGPILGAEHFLYVSEDGDVTGAAELVMGLPLTPSLTFEPRAGISWSAQDIPEEETLSGINGAEFAVRLRQAIGPVVNVYVGVIHERLLGDARDVARIEGERVNVTRAILGAGFAF